MDFKTETYSNTAQLYLLDPLVQVYLGKLIFHVSV